MQRGSRATMLVLLATLLATSQAASLRGAADLLHASANANAGAQSEAEAIAATESEVYALERSVVEQLLRYARLPGNVTDAQNDNLVKVIAEQIEMMQGRLDAVSARNAAFEASATGAEKAKYQKDSEQRTHKMRLHMTDFMNKLKESMRFVKNGALKQNTKERQHLHDVLDQMSTMVGWSRGSFDNLKSKVHIRPEISKAAPPVAATAHTPIGKTPATKEPASMTKAPVVMAKAQPTVAKAPKIAANALAAKGPVAKAQVPAANKAHTTAAKAKF